MNAIQPMRRLSLLAIVLITLWGCSQQRIRDDAASSMRSGNYEAALATLQEGLIDYPESATLKAGLASTKADVVTRIASEATQQRSLGRYDEAEKTIKRGLAMDPGNERLLGMQSDLVLYQRQKRRLEDINRLIDSKETEQALQMVELALREFPRQPELLLLQRRLETEIRLSSDSYGRNGLAETRPISLDFRNTPVSTVLDAITRGSGINFILDRDVRQDSRVTIFLRSASVEDAIDLVITSSQLAQRIVDPKTVLIYPNTPEKQKEHQEQVIRVFHLANAEAKATATMLRSILKVKEPYVDERANLIVIRESPNIVALAERLVALHDLGDAEVMLEVEIMEIKTTRLTELGLNFPSSVTMTPLAAAGESTLTLSSLGSLGPDRTGISIGNLVLNLRREVGDYNLLANPRIRSKNKEKAKIMIGDKVPVITSTASSTGFVSESISYLDVGLKLDVEPIVSPDDEVTLKIGLEVSSLTKEVKTSTGTLAYQLGSRNATTTLRLRDGETQLLGGLINNDDRSTASRVPGLGDLPVLGRLFASQKDDLQRTELVLAITPHILRPAPRPDITQAEMWVGPELSTRLRASPGQRRAATQSAAKTAAKPGEATGSLPSTPTALPEIQTQTLENPLPVAPNIVAVVPAELSWKSPKEVKEGETFVVSVLLNSQSQLRGAPFEISYTPSTLELVEVTEGTFFKKPEGNTNFTHAVNPQKGRISFGILRSDAVGSSGEGNLVSLKLKAKSSGAGELRVVNFRPISPQGMVTTKELPLQAIQVN